MELGLIIIIVIIALVILYAILKPYIVKYDTTLAFTGGLGAGKTLNAVKTAKKLYTKVVFNTKMHNWFIRQKNKIINLLNKSAIKYNNKHKYDKKPKMHRVRELEKEQEMPRFFSNIPVLVKKRKGVETYSNIITKDMLLLKERIPEYSIVLIDELPQMVNQFNWNETEVQNNLNEFITFFRHYIGGYFIVTAQSIDDVVAQIRRKLNTYYWLFDFHKFLHFFYKVRICQFQSSDIVSNVNQGFIEDNAKWKYGCLFRKIYDSRCYSERYEILQDSTYHRYARKKTKKIIRFSKYESPLDPKTNKEHK